MRIPTLAHGFFALTLISLGVIGLVNGAFTPTWAGVPRDMPAREVLAYACAAISLVTGVGLLLERLAAPASRALLACFVAWLVLFRLSHFLFTPTAVDTWWGAADTSAMLAAALVLYVRCTGKLSEKGLRVARTLFGVALIPFGLAHFLYMGNTAPLVPNWLPWHTGWGYFTGGAFIAAGLALITGVQARLAAMLAALQIALFTLLVWVPTVATGHPTPVQWTEFLGSWALTAAAWVVADSYRGITVTRKNS
jgi:uncharacterized membrane protein